MTNSNLNVLDKRMKQLLIDELAQTTAIVTRTTGKLDIECFSFSRTKLKR